MKTSTYVFLKNSLLIVFLLVYPLNSHALFSGLLKGILKVGDEVVQGASKGDNIIYKNIPNNTVTDNNTLMKVFESTDQRNYDEFLKNFKGEVFNTEPPEMLGSLSELSNLELWLGFQAAKASLRKKMSEKENSTVESNLKLECSYNEKFFYFSFFKTGEIVLLGQNSIETEFEYLSESKEFDLQKEYNSQIHNLKVLLDFDFDIFVLENETENLLFSIKKISNSPFSLINTETGNLTIKGITAPAESTSMSAKGWHDWFISKGVDAKELYKTSLWNYLKDMGSYDEERGEFTKNNTKTNKIKYENIKKIINRSVKNNNTNYIYSFDIYENPIYQIKKLKGETEKVIYESNNLDDIYDNFPKSNKKLIKKNHTVDIQSYKFNEVDGNGCNVLYDDHFYYKFKKSNTPPTLN